MGFQSQIARRGSGLVASVGGSGKQSSAANDEQFTSQVCIANIGPKQRHRRLMFGLYVFVLALAVLAMMLVFQVDVWWRLPLFLLFASAAAGYFQARDHT